MKKAIIFSLILIISSFFFIRYNIQNNTSLYFALKQHAPQDLKKIIRSSLTKLNTLYVYNSSDFSFKKKKGIELDSLENEKIMKVFSNSNLIWTGPRAYFTSDQNNLFLISGTGILMYVNKSNINLQDSEIKFKTINTNLEDILKNYKEDKFYSFTSMVKSIIYKEEKLFISLVQKINENCFTHIIYSGDKNLKKIKFEEFYKFERCKPFYTDYLGGTLADYKKNKILITIGDWTICEDRRWLDNNPKGFCTENGAQSQKTEFGKIFELDLTTKDLKIISIGHDNPQGVLFVEKQNAIISTEHGPKGGDEININRYPSSKIMNFGYPISSYGEHYSNDKYLYEEAPLYKSHKDYGFEEPVDYFVPSIGISDIEKYNDKLFVASMGAEIEQGDLSLYVYSIDSNLNLTKKTINNVYQRIRDIHIFNDHVFLFLESTGSIGIFPIKNIS